MEISHDVELIRKFSVDWWVTRKSGRSALLLGNLIAIKTLRQDAWEEICRVSGGKSAQLDLFAWNNSLIRLNPLKTPRNPPNSFYTNSKESTLPSITKKFTLLLASVAFLIATPPRQPFYQLYLPSPSARVRPSRSWLSHDITARPASPS